MIPGMLLTLLLGLAHADPRGPQLSGAWRTLAIAADPAYKVAEGQPLRLYMRNLRCRRACEILDFRFYVLVNGDCQGITVETKHVGNGVYRVQYEGDNHFTEVKQKHHDRIIFYNENLDASGRLTRMIVVLGKGKRLDAEQQLQLEGLAAISGIPKENIQHVRDTDVCPK